MRCQVTQQYGRGVETLFATFADTNDAKLFVEHKSAADEIAHVKLIYRLYQQGALHHEFNKEKIPAPIARAQYASHDADLPYAVVYPFKATQQGSESPIAMFMSADDAEIFLQGRQSADTAKQVSTVYCLFEGNNLLKEFAPEMDAAGSQGKQSGATFRPTPFATAPRVGPPKWLNDEEENEKK